MTRRSADERRQIAERRAAISFAFSIIHSPRLRQGLVNTSLLQHEKLFEVLVCKKVEIQRRLQPCNRGLARPSARSKKPTPTARWDNVWRPLINRNHGIPASSPRPIAGRVVHDEWSTTELSAGHPRGKGGSET